MRLGAALNSVNRFCANCGGPFETPPGPRRWVVRYCKRPPCLADRDWRGRTKQARGNLEPAERERRRAADRERYAARVAAGKRKGGGP